MQCLNWFYYDCAINFHFSLLLVLFNEMGSVAVLNKHTDCVAGKGKVFFAHAPYVHASRGGTCFGKSLACLSVNKGPPGSVYF